MTGRHRAHFQLPVEFQAECREVETLHLGHRSFPRPVTSRDEHQKLWSSRDLHRTKNRERAECHEAHTDGAAPDYGPADRTVGEMWERLTAETPKVWLSV